MAIRHSQQCPHWLKPGGCREPQTCQLGLHDEQLKGKGPAPTTKGQPPAGKGATKGAHDAKGGGKGKKGEKGDKGGKGGTKAEPPRGSGPLCSDGREACLKFQDGRCDDPNCPRSHGPFTKAQQKAFKDWKAKREQRGSAASAAGSGTDTEQPAPKPKAEPKAKAKAQP